MFIPHHRIISSNPFNIEESEEHTEQKDGQEVSKAGDQEVGSTQDISRGQSRV
jgi:hypothetical protein